MLIHFMRTGGPGDDTLAFREALRALGEAGGGELRVPPGEYYTHPLQLTSGITFRVDAGATIHFISALEDREWVKSEFEGQGGLQHKPLLFADGAERVRVTGDGTLDGNGQNWWRLHRAGELRYPRPFLVCFQHSRHVRVENIHLINSPVWTLHPYDCEDVRIQGITIRNPHDSPNTDGIDPNQCRDVRIADCFIDVGDDCVAVKAGTEDTASPGECRDILISGCHMQAGHGGVVIGSEMSGNVRNVMVSDCIFTGTDRGIRIKTRRGRGGLVRDVHAHHVLMDGVMCPLVVNMMYECGKNGKLPCVSADEAPLDNATPVVRDVRLDHVTARNVTGCAAYVQGLPESPAQGIALYDCTFDLLPGAPARPAMWAGAGTAEATGLHVWNAREADCRGVRLHGLRGEALNAKNSTFIHQEISVEA